MNRWQGLTNWWRNLLDFNLILDIPAEAPEDKEAIPAFPRAGKHKLTEAVYDFLNAAFVENMAGQAVAYVADEAYACYEPQGVSDGKPLNRGIAPFLARKRIEATSAQLHKALGEITDLRPKDSSSKEFKSAKAPPELIEAMTRFHRDWFVKRYYPGELKYLSIEAFECRKLYLQKGKAPPADMDEFLERWREGMQQVVQHRGLVKTLAEAIHAVTLSADQLAVVPHPEQDAFTIFALSDELGEEARCSASVSAPPEIGDELLRQDAGGDYYAAAFEAVTAGGNPATLITLWRKIDGAWKIYSYRIDTP